ncbi:hypothetical protein MTR67_038485 [Solanum verrucosum]|uniref:Uncharacterized protein n=1 Tax=Solanum verrucosum TaxID=315347 RepID=A0AAF0UFA3_SOLVR|nr:hypothetical protein MTR67_038485 [Solanum verrucosum]
MLSSSLSLRSYSSLRYLFPHDLLFWFHLSYMFPRFLNYEYS